MAFRIIVENVLGDRVENALWMVNRTLQCAGLQHAATIVPTGEAETSEQHYAQMALDFINDIQLELFDLAGTRYGHVTWEEFLFPETRWYDVPTGFMEMRADPKLAEHQLSELTMNELDSRDPAEDDEGTPSYYAYDTGRVGVYPTPNEEYFTDKVCTDGGNTYVCTLKHTADATNRPTGVSGATYWTLAAGDYAAYASMSSITAWTDGLLYKVPVMTVRYQRGLAKMTDQTHSPTLPNWFYPAMIAGACWMMKMELEFSGQDREAQKILYDQLKTARIAARRFHKGNPRVKIRRENRL